MLWLDLGNTRLKYWLTDDIGQIVSHDAKQHLQAPDVPAGGGLHQWGPPLFVCGVDLGAAVKQHRHRLVLPMRRRKVQCGIGVDVNEVDVAF